jgi:hypothetical protein
MVERMEERVSWMKGSEAAGSAIGFSARTSSMLRTGFMIAGPFPLITSNSMPNAGSGVNMSEKKMTASVPNALHGCSDSSIAISGVSERWRKAYLSENLSRSGGGIQRVLASRNIVDTRSEILIMRFGDGNSVGGVLSELRHVAARLTHEPDRCALHI